MSTGRGGGPWFAALMQQWQAAGLSPLGVTFSPGLPPLRMPGVVLPRDPTTAAHSQRMGGPAACISAPPSRAPSPAPFAHPAVTLQRPPFGGWWGAPLHNTYATFCTPAYPAQPMWPQHPVAAVPAPPHAWGSMSMPGPDSAAATRLAMAPVPAAVPVTDANYDVESSEADSGTTPESLADAADQAQDAAAEPRAGGAGGLAAVDDEPWQRDNGRGACGKRGHAEACAVEGGAQQEDEPHANVVKRCRASHA